MFYCTISGTASVAICGFLSNYLNAASNPAIYGQLLAFFSGI
jgi:hypothetical protein